MFLLSLGSLAGVVDGSPASASAPGVGVSARRGALSGAVARRGALLGALGAAVATMTAAPVVAFGACAAAMTLALVVLDVDGGGGAGVCAAPTE